MIEAQFIEMALLANFNHATLVTTVAKRIITAANGIPVMKFGARKVRGVDSAIEASKYAYVGDALEQAMWLQQKCMISQYWEQNMAHSMFWDADNEYEAYLSNGLDEKYN